MNYLITVLSADHCEMTTELFARTGEQASIAARHMLAFALTKTAKQLLQLDYQFKRQPITVELAA